MSGFEFEKHTFAGAPTVEVIRAKDFGNLLLTKGDIANLEAGELDLGVAADTNLLGVVLGPKANGARASGEYLVITDEDAEYVVQDLVARKKGDTLDLAGATGAQGVAASSSKTFVVVSDSPATERTRVRINVGKHHNNKAQ
jgi:hypothetical protein